MAAWTGNSGLWVLSVKCHRHINLNYWISIVCEIVMNPFNTYHSIHPSTMYNQMHHATLSHKLFNTLQGNTNYSCCLQINIETTNQVKIRYDIAVKASAGVISLQYHLSINAGCCAPGTCWQPQIWRGDCRGPWTGHPSHHCSIVPGSSGQGCLRWRVPTLRNLKCHHPRQWH